MKTSTMFWIAVAAAGGYSLYQKNKTNQWPWETMPTANAPGAWGVSIYYTGGLGKMGVSEYGTESDARAAAARFLASCPTCKITLTNPSGGVVYQVNG